MSYDTNYISPDHNSYVKNHIPIFGNAMKSNNFYYMYDFYRRLGVDEDLCYLKAEKYDND